MYPPFPARSHTTSARNSDLGSLRKHTIRLACSLLTVKTIASGVQVYIRKMMLGFLSRSFEAFAPRLLT
jgi:hypothetical protein